MRQSLVASAKIGPPRLATVLLRERLFARLDELKNCPIVWIGGCPGAGKTTLVANYLEARQLPRLWYRIERDDHDGRGLFDFLNAAGMGPELQGCAKRQATEGARCSRAEGADNRGASARLCARELYERLSQPGVLVLDDCHEIAPDSLLHAFLVDSVGEIPPGLNVILVGRGRASQPLFAPDRKRHRGAARFTRPHVHAGRNAGSWPIGSRPMTKCCGCCTVARPGGRPELQ